MRASPAVDEYVQRSQQWPEVIDALRPILRGCGLAEDIKWRKPCYSHDGKNIVIVQEMKPFLAMMFFKGALLDDRDGVLEAQGPNSRSAMRMCFTTPADVRRLRKTITSYVEAAIALEDAGATVPPPGALELVDELRARLDEDPGLAAAFAGLTPGRQREYNLHISSAKQSATRTSRVEKCVPTILAGKGMRDR